MPVYDYRCRACGDTFDQRVSLSDPTPACPACGAPGGEVDKLLSAPNFVLKGSGWYRDHYGLKASSGADSGGSSGGDKASSGGSDS